MVVRAWGRGACVRILCATLWSGVVLEADVGASESIDRKKITDDVAGIVLSLFMEENLYQEDWWYTESVVKNWSHTFVNTLVDQELLEESLSEQKRSGRAT